ncbi:DUF1707 SHOCT-like domain-containing protein [Jiangella rhizosphaerae]|uniref:DUF1707 SHOCT-like domain-containing protein n=1 Tax=Jiangella rhizosphaerae TaxID=2293569 RepID=UPI0018F519BD|nr:DUF1707 domain-containing protein [Jiangella rhizosphaerae]
MARGQDRQPGDGDRRRYSAVLDTARTEGRIDDAEFSRRSFTVRYARTMGELDAVVDDLPGPPATPKNRVATVVVVGAVVVAAVGAGLLVTGNTANEPPAQPPPAAEAPAAEPVEEAEEAPPDLRSVADLTRMWDELAQLPVAGIKSMYVYEDRARLEVQTAPGALTYDDLDYDGTLSAPEPGTTVNGDDPDSVFFPLSDVDPAVVAACAAHAAQIAGREGRAVEMIVISRDVFYGDIVTINVHLETDAYGVGSVVTWDATGQYLLDDGIDQ